MLNRSVTFGASLGRVRRNVLRPAGPIRAVLRVGRLCERVMQRVPPC